jgi:hypothetical protein
VWRLVIERVATLHEIETHYSVDDVLQACEALDLKQQALEEAREEAAKK